MEKPFESVSKLVEQGIKKGIHSTGGKPGGPDFLNTIHIAGQMDSYIKWLERQVKDLNEQIKNDYWPLA